MVIGRSGGDVMNDNTDDTAYYRLRAKQENEAARKAANSLAAAIHRTLASRYEALAKAPDSEERQKLSIVRD